MEADPRQVRRAAGVVAAATLLSRLLGYARDMAIAWIFGAGIFSDAFIAAFRLPNLLRRLLGEGALNMAFIPVFSDTLSRSGPRAAVSLAATAFRHLAVLLVAGTVAGLLISPFLAGMVAPGFVGTGDKFELTLGLVRVMMPYLPIVGLLALFTGVLNAMGVFGPPALAPALLNLGMLSALGLSRWMGAGPHNAVIWLAWGVLAGGILQLALQLPALGRCGFRFAAGSWRPPPELLRMARRIPPAVLGVAVFQINILVGTLLASLLEDGSVSYLFFADRLVQFPLGLVATSAAVASLPAFSRMAAAGDMDGLDRTLDYGLRNVLFLMLPAAVGLGVLARPIVSMLFERGAFQARDAGLTAQALVWYACGIWAVAATRVITPAFYALHDVRTPVLAGAFCIAANLAAGVALMGPMGHCGVALATALASVAHLALLLWALSRRGLVVRRNASARATGRMAACAAGMGAVVFILVQWLVPEAAGPPPIAGVAACTAAGVLIYGGLSLVAGVREARGLMTLLTTRRQPG
jgi:putative peptidoglycan lipid II flippase